MSDLLTTTVNAFQLLFSGDDNLWAIIWVSLRVSLYAILISLPIALTVAFGLANYAVPFKKIIVSITHTLIAVPAVVVGLVLYLLLSKYGVLGDLGWLFTQKAMILGQILLALPILTSICYSAFSHVEQHAKDTAITLGANRAQVVLTLFFECRFAIITAFSAAFGRIIAEVGSAMMIGGNILHHTRNITTAIALETQKGEFVQGIALGIVLVVLALVLNFTIAMIHRHKTIYTLSQ